MTLFHFIVAAGFGLLNSTAGYLYIAAAAAAAVYLCRATMKIRKKEDPAVYIVHGGILSCFLLYWLLREHSPVIYLSLNNISLAVSGVVGRLIKRPIEMGMTYSGVDMIILFVISSIAAGIFKPGEKPAKLPERKKKYKKAAAGSRHGLPQTINSNPWFHMAIDIASILAIWAFYIGFWTVLAENSITLGVNLLEPLTGPLDFRFLLFGLLSAAFALRHGKHVFRLEDNRVLNLLTRTRGRRVIAGAATPAICLASMFIILYNPVLPAAALSQPASGQPPKRIVFWDSGLDFSMPQKGVYGLDRVGMFGVLPVYLQNQGYSCEIIKEINGETLDGAGVLVVINPSATPAGPSLNDIAKFVANGGSVLAVGDHTGDEQIRKPLNAILAPAGIALNFDSAIPFQGLWPQAFTARKSPVFRNITERQYQIVVGASLECGFRAKPLLIGRLGFSDRGDIDNVKDGYLGDMRFSRGERFGDLILVAEANYGKGKYMAFGDTTPFQNTVIAYSAPFIDNIFSYLTGGAIGNTLDLSSGISGGGMNNGLSADSFFCLIDAYNMPGFTFDKTGEAADGFIASALRSGMLPYLNMNESLADALNRVDKNVAAVMICGTAKKYSRKDIAALNALLGKGGSVILFCDYESPAAATELCAAFGFGFDALPLGRAAPASNPGMAFWNACPVTYDGAEGAETLISVWDYPVVCCAGFNGGEVTVTGDASFIKNKNLEDLEEFNESNAEFLIEMLERARINYGARARGE